MADHHNRDRRRSMLLRAHTGVTGADFVDFVLDIEQWLRFSPDKSIRIRMTSVARLEKRGVLVEGEIPDPDMDAFVFEESI